MGMCSRATSAMHPAWDSDMPVFWKLFVLHHLGARIVTLKRLPEIECFGNGRPLASYLSFSSDLDMPATTCGSDWNQPNFRTVVEEMIVKSCCDEVIGRGVFFSPVLSAMFLHSWSAHPHTLTRKFIKKLNFTSDGISEYSMCVSFGSFAFWEGNTIVILLN